MSNADWWAKKLGNPPQQPQARPINMPTPASQQPMTPYRQPQQPTNPAIQSATQNESCPECGGNNYMSPQRNIAPRCIDCGYPISQSGSRYGSLAGARVEGSAREARGNSTGGFNPMPAGYNADGTKQG